MTWRPGAGAIVGVVLAIALVGVGLGGCSSDHRAATPVAPAGAAPPAADDRPARGSQPSSLEGVEVRLTSIATVDGLATSLAASHDGRELLVGERSGLVGRIRLDEVRGFTVPVAEATPVLDLRDRVATAGEQGLLGLAIDRSGTRLLVAYTATDGAVTVEVFPYRSGRPIEATDGRTILAVPHPFYDNNGGDVQVTVDGDVLVSIGDMGTGKSSDPAAQDPTSPLGKVLRLPRSLVEGGESARVPDLGSAVVASGLRNPWRLAVDADTGALWIADVGEKQTEEIDVVGADDLAGSPTDFGWPFFEGSTPFRGTPPAGTVLTGPVLERRHGDGVCAVVGGRVYRGRAIPALYGAYLYGDTCSSEIRALSVVDGKVVDDVVVAEADTGGAISFGSDAAGELYLLDGAGTVSRLDPADWKVPPAAGVVARAAEAAPTTTTSPRGDPAHCALVADLQALSDVASRTPAEVEALFTRIRQQLDGLDGQVAGDSIQALAVLRAAFAELAGQLEALGWNVQDPAFAGVLQQATRGEGEYAGMAQALSTLLPPLAAGCPSD